MSQDQEKLWSEVCKLFKAQSPKTGEKFTELLVKAKEERLSLLTKTIEFLYADGHELFYIFGICTFIQSILELMVHSYQLSHDAVCDMLNFIIAEARHFSTPALVKTVSYCLEFMSSNDEVNLPVRWIEVFGKIVAVLATRGEIESKGELIHGQEYKQEVITEICRIHWGQQNGASLIAALREIPGLDGHDVRTILDKAGKCIRNLEPASIPPIAYQLLLLAGSTYPSSIVGYFDDYFGGVDFVADSSEEGAAMNKRKALGTTVYHFVEAARTCEPLLKEVVKRIKASQFCHSLVVSPFMISVSLGLTVIDYMKPVIIGAVKTTILKWFIEIHRSKTYRWYYEYEYVGTIPDDSVSSCFTRAIDARTTELDFMLDGLNELGIGLLNMDQTGSKDMQWAKTQCSGVGDHILTSLLSKEEDYLPILMNEFLKNQTSITNIECLASCLKKVVRPFVRKKFVGKITELIHHLPLMTVETAVPILKALLPALQLSFDLLGEVVMVLRKTIWKSVEARKISVTAMILLLSNSRIVGEIPRSQYSSSQIFSSSQLADSQTNILGSSNKNESICFEVLSILRRFFTQQLEVREHLYIGIYNVARQNPELISFLCSHVQSQMQSYMTTPGYESIRLDKMIEFSSGQTILLEPLGFLVQCVSFLLTKSRQIYGNSYEDGGGFSDEAPASVLGCAAIIGTWIEGVGSILNDDFNRLASKILPPGLSVEVSHNVKAEFIIQVMQVIEALIEYLCLGGEPKNRNDLFLLFAKFNEMKEGLKLPSIKKDKKGKKRKATKDKNDSDPTLQLSGANTSTDDFLPAAPKEAPPKKLTYIHIMATEHLSEILAKLYTFEESDEFDPIAPVRDDKAFDAFLLGILRQKLNSLNHKETLKERQKDSKVLNTHLSKIAHNLWDRANKEPFLDPTQLSTADNELSILDALTEADVDEIRLELALDILDYLFLTFSSDRRLILSLFLNEDEEKSYNELFSVFFQQFTQHVQHGKKYVLGKQGGKGINHLFKILDLISSELTTQATDTLTTVLAWFTTFLGEPSRIFTPGDSDPEPSQTEAILKAFISITVKLDALPERFLPLAKRAHFLCRDLAGETQSFAATNRNEKFWLVTEKTAPVVLHQFALYSENTLSVVKDIMGRLSCIYVEEEKAYNWREKCCLMMQFLVKLLTHLVRSKFPVGPWVDVMRRTAVQFFNMMTSITESFVNSHSKAVGFRSKGFEALVKAIGIDFKIRAEAMIHHIDDIRRKALETGVSSAKFSISKDTRVIPTLIYSIERYEQQLIALCQKAKLNLLVGTKTSAPRDFKILYNPPK